MAKEINDYIASCSTCAQAKVWRHFPVGKLVPLKNPQRPWSHLSIGPGKTVVMVTMDGFSRSKTVELIFNQVFRYGIPVDIVSDRGHKKDLCKNYE